METPRIRLGRMIALAAAGVVVLQGLSVVIIGLALPSWTTRGQFGDLFGAVNAFFSGLAFFGVIYAVLLQREDLAIQQAQIETGKAEAVKSATVQERIAVALAEQACTSREAALIHAQCALLDHCKRELAILRRESPVPSDPRHAYMNDLQSREVVLTRILFATMNARSEGTTMEQP